MVHACIHPSHACVCDKHAHTIRYTHTHTHLAGRGRGDPGIWPERFVPLGWPVAHTLALILPKAANPKARPQSTMIVASGVKKR